MTQNWRDKDIDRLTVIGRQCVAVICLERFCRKYGLTHLAITKFIDHVWKVTQVGPETFVDWDEGFQAMPITGQGDPYPSDLKKAIPVDLMPIFDRLTQLVFETSASTWYGDDLEATKDCLREVLRISIDHDVEIPDLGYYVNAPVEHRGGWGPSLSDEQVRQWRGTA